MCLGFPVCLFQKVDSMKTFISLSCISLLALSVAACASGSPGALKSTELTTAQCKEHLSQYVPNQNKDDAAIRKDMACSKLVKG